MFDYDVALSFAGEERDYVSAVADVLHQLGVKIFYDEYEAAGLWGKDLYEHLDDVYQRRSQYCVLFASKAYAEKVWTNHERKCAQARAISQKEEYILPVRFDETQIPGLTTTVGYLDARKLQPSEVAHCFLKKLSINAELDDLLTYLKAELVDYEINVTGTELTFKCPSEQFEASFSVRLMLEMHRAKMIDEMFLGPSIVPY
ncbi:MAG: TIR domain-containing protein [Capsulimonadaceae bacterium]|nr:TIR domain-containing protein [Capsulimonadaceae bacterium]